MKTTSVLLFITIIILISGCNLSDKISIPNDINEFNQTPSITVHFTQMNFIPLTSQPTLITSSPFPFQIQTPHPTPAKQNTSIPEPIQIILNKAIKDLSIRFGISEENIDISAVNKIEMSIQDLRCIKQQNNVEIPAIIFGIEIILNSYEEQYRYIGYERQIYYCPDNINTK